MKSSAIGIVFTSDHQQVLLIKRCDVPIWVFPGGGVEIDESPEVAVVREVLEETGLSVSVKRKVAEYQPVNTLSNYTYVFECSVESGELTTGAETRNLGFHPISDLPYPFLHVHQYWLNDALANSPVVIKKKIEGTSWLSFVKFLFTHPMLMGRYLLSWVGLTINSSPEK